MQCWFSFHTSFCDKQVLLTCNVGNKAKPGKRREERERQRWIFISSQFTLLSYQKDVHTTIFILRYVSPENQVS